MIPGNLLSSFRFWLEFSAIVPSIHNDESQAVQKPVIFGVKSSERKKRLDHHFDDLSKTYLERRCQLSSKFKFDDFSNTVAKFTQYDSLQVNSSLNFFLMFPRPKPLYNIRPICSLKVQLFPLSILTAMLIISPWPELQRKLKFTIINEWSTAQSTKSTRQQWKWRASRKFHALHGISTTR